jgi:anti-sigma factor RsiW
MIDHPHARRLAAEAIDFALGPDDRAALDAHLATCDACRSVAERLTSDALALAMLPQLDSPEGLRAGRTPSSGAIGCPSSAPGLPLP